MNESGYGPQTRRRAAIAVAVLAGFIMALLPISPASAAAPTPKVTVTFPTFGDDVQVIGTPMTVTWATNQTGTATIKLIKDNNGVPVTTTLGTAAAKSGKFTYNVPPDTVVGSDYAVQVTVGAVHDESFEFFTMAAPTVTVSSPKAGDTLTTGVSKAIKWATKTSGTVDISLADTSNVPVKSIKTKLAASAGTYNWDIPVGFVTASGSYRVLVQSTNNVAIVGNTGTFTLNLASIKVDSPNGGSSYGAGTVLPIKWTTKAPGRVRIEYVDTANGNAVTKIAEVNASPSTYNWTIPAGLPLGSNRYLIRLTSMTGNTLNANVKDDSDTAFSIAAPSLAVSQPDATITGNSGWLMGTTHKVIWSAPGLAGNVKLDLMSGATTVKTLKGSVLASTNQFSWDIPANLTTASGTYTIKMSTVASPSVSVSSASFDINLPTIGTPGLTGTPTIGGTVGITWTTDLPSGTVKLEYIGTNNIPKLIKSGVLAKAGSYSWAVPANLAVDTYKIRVTSLGNSAVVATSSGTAFSLGTISVNTPATASAGGSAVNLSWVSSVSGTWKIDLADSNGAFVKTIKAGQAGSSYSWAIPVNFVTASGSYQIKVSNSANSAITDLSASFTINLPAITITAPTGGATITAGGSKTVSWTGLSIGSVKIELENASHVVTNSLKSSVLATSPSVSVTIPNTVVSGQTYYIKITSLSNTAITQEVMVTVP